MLRFNHIQKTAGNSLVSGLWEEFGKDRVYNGNLDLQYGGPELVARVAREIDAAVVYTHGPYNPLKGFFYPEDTFVFFRDPVERAISMYNHYLRGGGRRKFQEFIAYDANRQSRVTDGMPLDLVFIGLTDQIHRVSATLQRALRYERTRAQRQRESRQSVQGKLHTH